MAEPGEETEWHDATDADDRALLIATAHPELDIEAETALVDGHEIACASSATGGTESCTCSARR